MATDSLSMLRTVGFYMLSVCDLSKSQLAEFARYHGSSDSLLRFAMTYDVRANELMHHHILDTQLQRNVTELRNMMYENDFDETCNNLTLDERTELTLKWGHETEIFILTVDEIRERYVIPSILQVNTSSFGSQAVYCALSARLSLSADLSPCTSCYKLILLTLYGGPAAAVR